MRCPEEGFRLPDGEWAVLRNPEPSDAEARLEWLRRVNGETPFLARSVEDVSADAETMAMLIDDQLDSPDTMELGAFVADEMIGSCTVSPVSRVPRKRHRAVLGVAVVQSRWGRGVGSALLKRALAEAERMGFLQTELTVAGDNHRALALYRRFGFREAGRIPGGLREPDGSLRDEIIMVRETAENGQNE